MRIEGTYFGLTCILGVIIPKVPLVFLCMLRFVVIYAKSRIEVCITECFTLHFTLFKL